VVTSLPSKKKGKVESLVFWHWRKRKGEESKKGRGRLFITYRKKEPLEGREAGGERRVSSSEGGEESQEELFLLSL